MLITDGEIKGIINVSDEICKRRPSIIICKDNHCNYNGAHPGMTVPCCHHSHICDQNMIPKLALHL